MPVQPKPGDEAPPPAIDLSEDVFADAPAATAEEPEAEPEATDEPAEGSAEEPPTE